MNLEYKTRLDLEKYLRETYKTKNELADFCINTLNLEIIYKFNAPYIVLLHWCLDRLIKGNMVSITKPPIMNMLTMRWKSDLEKGERLKINAYSPTEEYLTQFGKRLAGLLANKQAFPPNDNEGIDLSLLTLEGGVEKKSNTKTDELNSLRDRVKVLEDKLSVLEDIIMNR